MMNVAIDGPAGAGKSTIAKLVSKKLGFIYVDTGAMYRAIAIYLLRQNVDKDDPDAIARVCEGADVSIRYENGEQNVYLNDENVTGLLRTEEVGNMASVCSAVMRVREKLLGLQQKLGKEQNVVMDGRDIGTTVLPDAQVKIYLTASSLVRAQRRMKELMEKGEECVLEEIEADIIERDHRDMTRDISPLRKAPDAVEVDSSYMTIEEVADTIMNIVGEKM